MHRSPCARCHRRRRMRTWGARSLRAWAFEDGTSALDAARSALWSLIDRSRPSLRHHNPPHRGLGNNKGSRQLRRFLNWFTCNHSGGRRFNRGSRHRRSVARLRRRCCTGNNRRRGSDGRLCGRDNNLRSGRLDTLGGRGSFHRGRDYRRTLRHSMCLALRSGGLSGCRTLCRCHMR